jgi:hypothetical protein
MSKRASLGAGLRAEMEQGMPPPVAAASVLQAPSGRPKAAEGQGRGVVRPRSVLATGEQRKSVTAYFRPGVSKWLKETALREDTTVNALVGEALDLLRRARGEHPFGER